MDTAGSNPSSAQQATGFAIPIDTALSIARRIAANRGSATIAIGYPGFLGIFIGTGSDNSPQDQAKQQQQQQQQQQQNGSSGIPPCSTSNAGLAAPPAVAPVSSGVLVDGTVCGVRAEAGMTSGAVITAVNGRGVGSPDNLSGVLARFHPRETISVAWVRRLASTRPAGSG